MRKTVTLFVPDGYATGEEFAKDCGFEIEHARTKVITLTRALVESLKLQSHYAGLLNQYDGGTRLQFNHCQDWINRLDQTNKKAT